MDVGHGGGKGQLGADALALALQSLAPSEFPYALGLDFEKVFDRASGPLCLAVLGSMGLPRRVLRALGGQWLHQR
eukprot:119307-Alexandrium_andersonii.AAC.1